MDDESDSVREQSQKQEMAAALRGDRERARARLEAQGLKPVFEAEPAAEPEPEAPPAAEPEVRRGFWSRLFRGSRS